MPFTLQDLYESYPDSDLLPCGPPEPGTPPSIYADHAKGDTLFQFLVRELFGDEETAGNTAEQWRRLQRAHDDIMAVAARLKERIDEDVENAATAGS